MIFFATPGYAPAPPVATTTVEEAATPQVSLMETTNISLTGGSSICFEGLLGERAEIAPQVHDVLEEFDWNDRKVMKEYIRLEQKVLAKQANSDEQKYYQTMKRDRHSRVFAERYLRDYAEVQRLQKLAEKMSEIQLYLRPINL